MQILFVYIYNKISSRPRRHTRRKRSMLCQNRPSLVRINIDSFVVLVSGKFPCFQEVGNQIGKDLFHMQCLSQLITKEQTHL